MARTVRMMAREAMMKFGYDPIDELVLQAQSTDNQEIKREVAIVLLPYMYPKLSNVSMEVEGVRDSSEQVRQDLMMKILDNPSLADAAQKLSLAAADAAIEREFVDTGRQITGTVQ